MAIGKQTSTSQFNAVEKMSYQVKDNLSYDQLFPDGVFNISRTIDKKLKFLSVTESNLKKDIQMFIMKLFYQKIDD